MTTDKALITSNSDVIFSSIHGAPRFLCSITEIETDFLMLGGQNSIEYQTLPCKDALLPLKKLTFVVNICQFERKYFAGKDYRELHNLSHLSP